MNNIQDVGAIAIANALKINSSMTALNLSNNNLGNDGVIALANALKLNSCLLSLILDLNRIGNDAVIAIAEALKCNICLTELNLRQCGIKKDGIFFIVDALRFNPTILDLETIFDPDLYKRLRSLKVNTEGDLKFLLEKLIGQDGGKVLSREFRMKFPTVYGLFKDYYPNH